MVVQCSVVWCALCDDDDDDGDDDDADDSVYWCVWVLVFACVFVDLSDCARACLFV